MTHDSKELPPLEVRVQEARYAMFRLLRAGAPHSRLTEQWSKLEMLLDAPAPRPGMRAEGEADDPTASAEWNAGCDFAMTQLCAFLSVSAATVSWDAATETVDGDVMAVIGNIFHAKFGEDWCPAPPKPAPDATVSEPDPLADLVSRFSKALLAKLKLAKANGRSGWERDDWETACQQGLLHHLEKGDPRDVAAYCAFMWHHGWITSPQHVGRDAERIGNETEALLANSREVKGSARDAVIEDRWQHVKRGTEYTVEGLAHLQMSAPLVDHQIMVIYRSADDGSRWVRSEIEFHDGRFRSLTGAKP